MITKDCPWGSHEITSDSVASERIPIRRWGKISLEDRRLLLLAVEVLMGDFKISLPWLFFLWLSDSSSLITDLDGAN